MSGDTWDWIGKLAELRARDLAVAVVTVAACSGSTPREPGAKMLVLADGTFFGSVGGGNLERQVLDDARACLAAGAGRLVRYPLGAKVGQCCGGVMDVLVEVVGLGPTVTVFGAGHVAQALCRVLDGTPFTVQVVDERPEWIGHPALPASARRHDEDWEGFVARAPWSAARSFAVIMTHRHDVDEALVAALLRKPLRWLGLIGSARKWARFQERLGAQGFTADELGRVRCPVGLDLGGGKAPQEVAISIAAELLQVLRLPR